MPLASWAANSTQTRHDTPFTASDPRAIHQHNSSSACHHGATQSSCCLLPAQQHCTAVEQHKLESRLQPRWLYSPSTNSAVEATLPPTEATGAGGWCFMQGTMRSSPIDSKRSPKAMTKQFCRITCLCVCQEAQLNAPQEQTVNVPSNHRMCEVQCKPLQAPCNAPMQLPARSKRSQAVTNNCLVEKQRNRLP